MLKINIEGILIYPIIGVYKTERDAPQELRLDLSLYLERKSKEDKIESTVDYGQLVDELTKKINQTSFYLIETLADYIIDLCINKEFVTGVKLDLYKPTALKNGLVSLEVERLCS